MNYQSLLNALPAGIFRVDVAAENGSFVFVNAALAQMSGKSLDALAKLSPPELFAREEVFRSLYQKALREGRAVGEDFLLQPGADGRQVPVHLTLVSVLDEQQNVVFVDGIVENQLSSQQVAAEKSEAKELFRSVFNNSAAVILVIDSQDKLMAWNPFAQQLLGWEDEALFNRPVAELFVDGNWTDLRDQTLAQKGFLSEVDTRLSRKDGQPLDMNMSASVVRTATGEVNGMIMIMLDISRQKETERLIRASENKIRIILDNSAAGITMTDDQERIISWNHYAEELLGKTKEDLYLQHVSVLYPPEEWQKIRDENIRRDGSRHHIETKISRKDGRLVDVDLSVNVLKDSDDQIIGSVGIMQDITEQKRVQQELLKAKIVAEEANSAKSLFLANMSHEVRTPMNTVIGMIDLTLDTPLTDEQRENLTTVKNAADILLSLLNDILDLSRVEAGKIQLENIELNLPNIIKSVCKGLSVLAHKKNVDLVWEVAPDFPDSLIGDPVRIRQILVNLINNAIKFTFKGNIVTKVKVESIVDDVCELVFSVKDEGVGIAQEKLNTIFEVFTQADASTTRRFGGTGLGLSISSKLVEMMGGRIWVESEEFRGSTFYFSAKMRISRRPETVVPEVSAGSAFGEGEAATRKQIKPLSILLAEDNLVNQKITARMLEKRGWTVKTAENGKQVLEYLDQGSFDIILMDAQMPILDGYEATRLIRQGEKPTGRHIPIVALTARAMAGDRKRCLDSGMDGYVTKPIDREKLYEAIEQWF